MVFLSQEQGGEAGLDNIEAAVQDMGCDKQIPVMILVLGRSLLFMCAKKGCFNFPCSFSFKPKKGSPPHPSLEIRLPVLNLSLTVLKPGLPVLISGLSVLKSGLQVLKSDFPVLNLSLPVLKSGLPVLKSGTLIWKSLEICPPSPEIGPPSHEIRLSSLEAGLLGFEIWFFMLKPGSSSLEIGRCRF
jgi:hypothetical protein